MNKETFNHMICSIKKELESSPECSEEDIDFDLDLDIKDAIVEPIDGVLIKVIDEEIRLLFYYHKPDGVDAEEEVIRCKGVAEFRTSKSTFKEIVRDVNEKFKQIKNQKKIDDYVSEKSPMFA